MPLNCVLCSITAGDSIVLVSAIVVLFVGLYTCRIQIISALQNQLYIKAQDINSHFIDPITQGAFSNTQNVSAIITGVLFGNEMIKNYFKAYGFLLLFVNKQLVIIDFFYLQFHTSIIEILKKSMLPDEVNDKSLSSQMQKQLIECHKFFSISFEKYKNV